MSINQLGRGNLTDLDNVTATGSHLDLFQQYWERAIKELVGSRQAVGIIYGGAVTVVSGLQVKVAKGLALFSNGIMVAWDDQNVTLTAANGANPRYDRIELAYSLESNSNVTNNDNVVKVLDKIHVATASAHAGVAAGSPAAPARTASSLSVALIHVAANQVALGGGDIDQTEDSATDLSYQLLGTSPYGIRYNHRLGILQSTADGATWTGFPNPVPKVITNADSPYPVTRANPVLECDTSGGNIVLILPALASGFPIEATKTTGDANTVTATPNGSEKINDDSTDVLDQKWANKVWKPLSIGWVIR
jgi:hypothetical protein